MRVVCCVVNIRGEVLWVHWINFDHVILIFEHAVLRQEIEDFFLLIHGKLCINDIKNSWSKTIQIKLAIFVYIRIFEFIREGLGLATDKIVELLDSSTMFWSNFDSVLHQINKTIYKNLTISIQVL